jgi:hypothetical protein
VGQHASGSGDHVRDFSFPVLQARLVLGQAPGSKARGVGHCEGWRVPEPPQASTRVAVNWAKALMGVLPALLFSHRWQR